MVVVGWLRRGSAFGRPWPPAGQVSRANAARLMGVARFPRSPIQGMAASVGQRRLPQHKL